MRMSWGFFGGEKCLGIVLVEMELSWVTVFWI